MALKNVDGNYLKITSINLDVLNPNHTMVNCQLWESEALRITPSSFTKAINTHVRVDGLDLVDAINDDTKSIKDNLITKVYLQLKAGKYSDWTDC